MSKRFDSVIAMLVDMMNRREGQIERALDYADCEADPEWKVKQICAVLRERQEGQDDDD